MLSNVLTINQMKFLETLGINICNASHYYSNLYDPITNEQLVYVSPKNRENNWDIEIKKNGGYPTFDINDLLKISNNISLKKNILGIYTCNFNSCISSSINPLNAIYNSIINYFKYKNN